MQKISYLEESLDDRVMVVEQQHQQLANNQQIVQAVVEPTDETQENAAAVEVAIQTENSWSITVVKEKID